MKRLQLKRRIIALALLSILMFTSTAVILAPGGVAYADSEDVIFRVTNQKKQPSSNQVSDKQTKTVTRSVDVRITKTDIDTGAFLEGAEFGIYVDDVKQATVTSNANGIATYTITHSETLDTGDIIETYADNYDELLPEVQATTQSKTQAEAKVAQRVSESMTALETAFAAKTYTYRIVEETAPTGYDLNVTPSQTSNSTTLNFESKDPKLPPPSEDPTLKKTSDPVSGTEDFPTRMNLNEPLTYTLTVRNTNPASGDTFKKVVIEDQIPEGLVINEAQMKFQKNTNDVILLSASGECGYTLTDNKLVITVEELAPQDIMYFIIPTTTNKVAVFENTAKITSIDGVAKDIKSETTWHEVPDDPVIHKKSDPASGTKENPYEMLKGETLTYTLSITNTNPAGGMKFEDVLVSDPIPDGLVIDYDNIQYHINDGTPALVSTATGITPTYSGQSLAWMIAELKAQDTVHFIIPTKTNKVAVFENTAYITSIKSVTKTIKSETTWHEVKELPDPEIHKKSDPATGTAADPADMQLGETLSYTVSVHNTNPAGSDPKEKVVVVDPIPEGLTIDYDNIQYKLNATDAVLIKDTTDATLLYNGQELTFTIKKLNAQDIVSLIIPTTTAKKLRFENTAKIVSINDVAKEIKSETTYHEVPDPNSISDTGDREVVKEIDIQIIKTDATDKKVVLEGAVFDVFMDEEKLGSVTTGKDGKATYKHTLKTKIVSETMTVKFEDISQKEASEKEVKRLVEEDLNKKQKEWEEKEHTFRIVETKAPEGYQTITFPEIKSAAKTVLFEVVNPKTDSKEQVYSNTGSREVTDDTLINIEKTDVETGEVLQGAVFDIYENGKKLGSITTDAQGKATYTIPHKTTITTGVYSQGYTDDKSRIAAEKAVNDKIQAELDKKEQDFKNTVYEVVIVEAKAPEGYMITEVPAAKTADNKITFIVKDRKKGVLAGLRDRIAPQTGDFANMKLHIVTLVIGLMSGLQAGVLYIRLRKGMYVDDGGIE